MLLDSFVRANPWFRGPVVLIHDGLPASARRQLAAVAPLDVQHRVVNPRLSARVHELAARQPSLRAKQRRFLSLEAFNLREHDTVLFVDSDVLCTGSVEALLAMDGALVCCADLVTRDGRARDATTFLPRPAAAADDDTVLRRCFNAGVMVIRPGQLPPDTFEHLLAELDPRAWDDVRSGHTDQLALNRHFRDRWTSAATRYNWLVSPAPARGEAEGRRLHEADALPGDAVFVHLVGRPKPWERSLMTRRRGARAEACRRWDAAHRRFMRARLMALDPRPVAGHVLHLVRRIGRGLRVRVQGVLVSHPRAAND